VKFKKEKTNPRQVYGIIDLPNQKHQENLNIFFIQASMNESSLLPNFLIKN